jgi:hypothetical protein
MRRFAASFIVHCAFTAATLGTVATARAFEQPSQPDPAQPEPSFSAILHEQLTLQNSAETKFIHNRDSDPTRPPVIALLDFRGEVDGHSSVSSGAVSIFRQDTALNIVIGPEHPIQISIPIDYELSHYNFRGTTGLAPDSSSPVSNVYQLALTPNFDIQLDDHWSAIGGGIAIFAGENGVSASDCGTYGGFGGAKWIYDSDLTIRFGVAGVTRLEKGPLIMPFANIQWKIDDRTRLITEGLEARVEHDFTDWLAAKFVVDYDLREYRLDESDPVPGGVFRDHRVPLTLHLEIQPHAAVRFELWAGYTVFEEFQTDAADGHRIGRESANPYPMAGGLFEVIF